MSLGQFFRRYAEFSMGPQPEALAGLYAPTFIVGGPKGSRAFANDDHFLEWLGQVVAFDHERGMRTLTVASIHDTDLSPLHTLATVTWGAQLEKTGDRSERRDGERAAALSRNHARGRTADVFVTLLTAEVPLGERPT